MALKGDRAGERDEKGLVHAQIRFCIHMVDIVDDVSEFMTSKSYVASYGQAKNPDTKELDAMRARVMSGHESIAGMEQEDISAIAQHMLPEIGGRMTGGTFAHEGVNPVDIKHAMMPLLQKAGGGHGAGDPAAGNVGAQDVDNDGDEVLPLEGDSPPVAKKRKRRINSSTLTASMPPTSRIGKFPWHR